MVVLYKYYNEAKKWEARKGVNELPSIDTARKEVRAVSKLID